MLLLTCENIIIGYDRKAITKPFSFSVKKKDYLCIIGANGAGKSTLMKSILNLMPIIEGQIKFSEGLKQNEIGYLPQQDTIQRHFPASVGEIVLSGCLNQCGLRPFFTKSEKNLAQKNMERLGITSLQRKSYGSLSGGQQQRVLLARALCATIEMILLDEPTSGLDPKATDEMYDLIHSLNKKDGITVIMISHDVSRTVSFANKVLIVKETPILFTSIDDYKKMQREVLHE